VLAVEHPEKTSSRTGSFCCEKQAGTPRPPGKETNKNNLHPVNNILANKLLI